MSLPGKTETKKDRALLTEAIASMEAARTSLKAFRKTDNVRARSALEKQTKAVARALKSVRADAAGLLKNWIMDVEDSTKAVVTSKRPS